MGVMLTNKNWETPYYAHIGDKDKLGNMWSANLHYLLCCFPNNWKIFVIY